MSGPLKARCTSNSHRQTGNFLSIAKIIALIPLYGFSQPKFPTFPREDRWTADLSTALRFGRDDKGECGISKGEPLLNKSCSSSWVAMGNAALPFVISTEAQRSGEICSFNGQS
jgi:hypothetical protein